MKLEKDTKLFVKKTKKLSIDCIKSADLENILKIVNKGKKIDSFVSATLLGDLSIAYNEYAKLISDEKEASKHKTTIALLTRYLYENIVTFLYIYDCGSGKTKQRSKAFFYYGEFKRISMQGRDTSIPKREWKKFCEGKNTTSWHGRSFKAIADEINFSPNIYRILSQFTHPGIFTAEKIHSSEIYSGIMSDSVNHISAGVCDILNIAYKNNMHGITMSGQNHNELKSLIQEMVNYFEKK